MTPPPRWPHQQATLNFLAANPRSLDFSSPGTGKTRAHIENYARRPKESRKRLLVLCPKTLMISAWGNDIETFTPQLTVSFAYANQREEAFRLNTDVVIMNHDGVKWLADKQNQKLLNAFDHLIIDEGDAFKHATSQRSKALNKIKKYFAYRELTTGTPNPNSVTELWHPLLIIDDGQRLGTAFSKFRNAIQSPTQVGPSTNHLKWEDKPGAVQAVNELIADITIRHQFEDVMTHVPPNHRHTVQFDLAPRAKKFYEKLENDTIVATEGGAVVSAVHAASLRNKLLQIASGAVYSEGDENRYTVIDDTRYELIVDMIAEREHSVVFFNWRHQRVLFSKYLNNRSLPFAVIDGSIKDSLRADIVRRYQNGEYRTILLHPKTGAHGLTLTRGTTTIFASPIYESDRMEQGLARIYRGTQDKVTDTIFVEAKHTCEHLVYERLNDKAAHMTDLLDLINTTRAQVPNERSQ